jgi:enoyl-CoA hydratase/carnithine racemase
MNSFNPQMVEDFAAVWDRLRDDESVHAIVLRAAGDRAFSTGIDVKDRVQHDSNVWNVRDLGEKLSPKLRNVWKPVIAAVHGLAAGGAFYWINESDIVICSDDAAFFDPHVTYGMTSALEPIGMKYTVGLREVLRMTLLGLHERISADKALQIGLVTEVVAREQLWGRAHELAAMIASQPPVAVQGSVRAIWASLDVGRLHGLATGMSYVQIGNPIGEKQIDRATFTRPEWQSR